ncbi:MAG: hypothetical protein DWQ31_15480 [Planctomycetota bacterium]|nr:MAG: hypothetical protein DWQ31_15480 [Planctomycetota bacterium]REJ88874.1 MAG: hypothetical protein DWQ35_19245 [Planctomycetota bacterium]REK25668.1 MAG: hypothetical protein DWQ42_10445 [Planctomycetota bacterium]REK46586.1 MAG: hypothetical protein DWQ46_06860 [Planctomycetota bacterium]
MQPGNWSDELQEELQREYRNEEFSEEFGGEIDGEFTADGLLETEAGENHESVVDAIRHGDWSFEPDQVAEEAFDDTQAMPGSREKVDIMAERVRKGLPLWHSADRRSYDDAE